ncbi:MAG: PQQ-binding-like beta-propeller repeat protein [Bacteroidota bacterium]
MTNSLRLFYSIFAASQLFVSLSEAQFQNGNIHTGMYPNVIAANSAELNWRFKTGGAIRSSAVVSNGHVIFGSTDGSVYSLDLSGKQQWVFRSDGPVSSTPVISNGAVHFISRKNTLYAVSLKAGTQRWKRSLGSALRYDWGFDYYVGSVTIEQNRIYAGSADGNVYCLDLTNGKELWKYRTDCVIRSTPAVDESKLYFGDINGKLYSLDKMSGKQLWVFSTIGDTLHNDTFGFDRKALISSPTVYEGKVFVGSRDGFLYAVDKTSGKELWHYDYNVSWVISTVAVKNDILVTGTSDGRFVHALNTETGKELWRFATQATVWASPIITGNDKIVIPSNDGYVYCLELLSGQEVWRHKIGPQIFSSVVPYNDLLFFGSDDGYLYSLKTVQVPTVKNRSAKRAVFWMKDPLFQLFKGGMDVAIRDYFIKEGYAFYDETDVKEFLLQRINSDTASVLVFATNYFLPSLTKDTLGSNILQQYMRSGGRVVMLGMNPAAYQLDSTGKQITGINFLQAKQLTGIPYHFKDLRSHGGFYAAFITEEGKRAGLSSNFTAICALPKEDVTTVLAVDENDNAAAWIKTFSRRMNSGYIQLFLSPDRLYALPEIQKIAEIGLY